jgi:hypothetical protein
VSSEITPGERRELRSVVRARMKVLRAEVQQRRAELIAEAEGRLVDRYLDHDKTIDDLNWRIKQVADQANKDVRALVEGVLKDNEGLSLVADEIRAPYLRRQNEDRSQLHRALRAGIDAQVESATLDLDRREADLLQSLAMGSLETDAARAFLAGIPTVGELVPAARLREIEAAFDDRPGRGA